jgi:hypothetical protein
VKLALVQNGVFPAREGSNVHWIQHLADGVSLVKTAALPALLGEFDQVWQW